MHFLNNIVRAILISLTTLFTNTALASEASMFDSIFKTPLDGLLNLALDLTPHTALAIVLMTLTLRLLLSPLQYLSTKSMNKMKEIQPKLEKIKEKFKDDPKKLQEKTMAIFKENSVNPIMSFLPILIQAPVFIALMDVLNSNSRFIGEGLFGWITDISIADPFFVLPIIAGIIQFLVMKNSGQMQGPMANGKKLQFAMASVFTIFMAKMPVAFLIYSITSSTVAAAEKFVIGKIV